MEGNPKFASFFVNNLQIKTERIWQNLSVICLITCSEGSIKLCRPSPPRKPMAVMIESFQWYSQDKILDNTFDTVQIFYLKYSNSLIGIFKKL